jgi:hypothetical protein
VFDNKSEMLCVVSIERTDVKKCEFYDPFSVMSHKLTCMIILMIKMWPRLRGSFTITIYFVIFLDRNELLTSVLRELCALVQKNYVIK